jgi:hypothetical protein
VGEKPGDDGKVQYRINMDSAKEELEDKNFEFAHTIGRLGSSQEFPLIPQIDVPNELPHESPSYTADREKVQAQTPFAENQIAAKMQFSPKETETQDTLISCVSSCHPAKEYVV